MSTTAEAPQTFDIYAHDLIKGDMILWKGELREVTLVSRMSKEDVYFEMGDLSDVVLRATDTVTVALSFTLGR